MKELSFERMEEMHGGGWFSDWGDSTAECVKEVYSDHGWATVLAWGVSAFVPELAATYIAYCAGKAFVRTVV